jgi:hypothetical protein
MTLVLLPSSALAGPVQARRADDFVDSFGVNFAGVQAWREQSDPNVIPEKLDKIIYRISELGVRHLRGGSSQGDPNYIRLINGSKTVFQQSHARWNWLTGRYNDPPRPVEDPSSSNDYIWDLEQLAGIGAVESAEGPNETDYGLTFRYPALNGNVYENTYAGYKQPTSMEGTRRYQQDVFQQVVANPSLSSLMVLSPCVRGDVTQNAALLSNLAPWTDYENLHNYSYYGVLQDNTTNDGDGGGGVTLDQKIANIHQMSDPAKQIVVTETGFSTGFRTGDNRWHFSELAQAKYAPRTLAENFLRGLKRTYFYCLLENGAGDNSVEYNYGLVRYEDINVVTNNSVKPAFTALKSLVGLLREARWNSTAGAWTYTNSNFVPSTLDYSVSGANVHHLLLQKSNGKFYLLLWHEAQSFDRNLTIGDATPADGDLNPSSTATITFAAAPSSVKKYEYSSGFTYPSTASAPSLTVNSSKQVSLTARDKVTVLEITSSAVPAKRVFEPVADTFVRSGSYANDNYGTAVELGVKYADLASGYNRKAYLRFDIHGVTTTVTNAKLRLKVWKRDTSAAVSHRILSTINDSWGELTTTANTGISTSTYADRTATVPAQGGWIEFDVTAFVNREIGGNRVASFVLQETSTTGAHVRYHGREAVLANRPQLVLTF